jgi:hypothetical protein
VNLKPPTPRGKVISSCSTANVDLNIETNDKNNNLKPQHLKNSILTTITVGNLRIEHVCKKCNMSIIHTCPSYFGMKFIEQFKEFVPTDTVAIYLNCNNCNSIFKHTCKENSSKNQVNKNIVNKIGFQVGTTFWQCTKPGCQQSIVHSNDLLVHCEPILKNLDSGWTECSCGFAYRHQCQPIATIGTSM